eukprot:1464184-Rhodomonas_salina.1
MRAGPTGSAGWKRDWGPCCLWTWGEEDGAATVTAVLAAETTSRCVLYPFDSSQGSSGPGYSELGVSDGAQAWSCLPGARGRGSGPSPRVLPELESGGGGWLSGGLPLGGVGEGVTRRGNPPLTLVLLRSRQRLPSPTPGLDRRRQAHVVLISACSGYSFSGPVPGREGSHSGRGASSPAACPPPLVGLQLTHAPTGPLVRPNRGGLSILVTSPSCVFVSLSTSSSTSKAPFF